MSTPAILPLVLSDVEEESRRVEPAAEDEELDEAESVDEAVNHVHVPPVHVSTRSAPLLLLEYKIKEGGGELTQRADVQARLCIPYNRPALSGAETHQAKEDQNHQLEQP